MDQSQSSQPSSYSQQSTPRPQAPKPKPNNKSIYWIIGLAACLPMLVVVGILGAMILVSLGSAREKAREAAGKAAVRSIPAGIAVCSDNNGKIQPAVAQNKMCDTVPNILWPTLPDGWIYGNLTNNDPVKASITATCDVPTCNTKIIQTCTLMGCQ